MAPMPYLTSYDQVGLSLQDDENQSFHFKDEVEITASTISGKMVSKTAEHAAQANSTILCVIEDSCAPVSCRCFEDGIYLTTVQISVLGYRIAFGNGKHFAEYNVRLYIDDVEVTVWRSFEQFKTFAAAFSFCYERNNNIKDTRLGAIVGAWNLVLRNRPWFYSSFTDVSFHLSEMSLLNKFLNVVLFELPHYAVIEEFVR